MELKKVCKMLKSLTDKRNLLLDQRLVHILINKDNNVVYRSTSGTAVLTWSTLTEMAHSTNSLGYVEVDSFCGMLESINDITYLNYGKSVKFRDHSNNSWSARCEYVKRSELEGNFYEGLVTHNNSMKELNHLKFDFSVVKQAAHSARSSDVLGHLRLCALDSNKLYTYRHKSLSFVDFPIKQKYFIDYKDLAPLDFFASDKKTKIEANSSFIKFSQQDIELCIMTKNIKKDFVKAFKKSIDRKPENTCTLSRKEIKDKLLSMKKIVKSADCKIIFMDKIIKLEAIFSGGTIKEQVSCSFEKKLEKKLTCTFSIDCMIDFLRAGKIDKIAIELSIKEPFNNSIKVTDGSICDLIALRKGGELS
jgi:hypothetical protein